MNKNKKNAFTLVELLAVIAILGLLLVIAVPKVIDTIKGSAFKYNEITSVKLPKYITTIENNAFRTAWSGTSITTIINPSGTSFDWKSITNEGTSETCTFITGTCGNIIVKDS